jgi:hypothetical protein
MPIERKMIPLEDAARVAELDSVAGCDFDVAQILKLRRTDSDRPLCSRGLHRSGGRKMATLDQKRFASMVRMLQTAYPKNWEKHLHNLGVTASANPPPADLDRIMEHVFWMVPQVGIKNPALWIATDMARVEAALASVEPEAPLKVALPAFRQNPVEFEPVKLGTDLAKTSGASPLASETGIKDPAAWIAIDTTRVEAALASVEPEAPLKVALPVAVPQNRVELEPVKLGTDLAKTSGASPLASETGIKDPAAWIATDITRVEAALASVEPEAPMRVALPIAVRQNPVELKPVKLGVDLRKTSGASPLALETAIVIARLLSQAKLAIEAGERREAAAAMSIAHEEYGASQQKIAAAVDKSQGWVSWMIRWRRERFKDDTPFGPASKDARERAVISRKIGQRLPRSKLWARCW